MTITTLSSRQFNQGASEAKRAAKKGPVFITDRGQPGHVLLSFADYQRLIKQRRNIADALAIAAAKGPMRPTTASFSWSARSPRC